MNYFQETNVSAAGNKYILAIDLGASGPKVALVSTGGEVIACEFEETSLLLLPRGGAGQNPAEWWQAIKRATNRLLAKGLVLVEDIVACSCTAQWSGTVAVDRAGRHLMNAIIWLDCRGAPYVQQVTSGLLKVEGYGFGKLLTWVRLTGGVPTRSGKDSIAHILTIKHEFPEIYRATYKFLEPKDYLNLRLTGKFAASYDSITLHWVTDNRDISRVAYHARLMKMSGLEREKLPDLKRAVDIYYTATDWPGGLYFSPTLAGSRPGALSAVCWAAMVSIGAQGYPDATRRILETASFIKKMVTTQATLLRGSGDPRYPKGTLFRRSQRCWRPKRGSGDPL